MENPETITESQKISHSRNSVYSLLSWLLPLGLTFLATPYIVRGLGAEQYGLYALIMGFIAYSLTFNIGRAVTKYVAEFSAKGEFEKISQVISATFFFGLSVATLGALVIAFAAKPLVYDVLRIQADAREETILAFYLAAACIWLLIVGQVFSAVVQAAHRFDIYSAVTTFVNAVLILGNLALVWNGYKFYHLVLWNAATIFFNGLAFFYFAKKLQPETRINLKFSKKIFLLSTKYGVNVAGYQIFGNLLFIWERIVITRVLGAEELTHFAVPMTVAIYINSFVTSMTLNFISLTSQFFARNQIKELETIYRRVNKLVVMMVVFICIALSIAAKPILANWIDPQFAEASAETFVVLVMVFGALACLSVAWQFIEGFGYPSYNTLFSLCWLVIAAPLMLVLMNVFGIEGAALARLAGEATIPLFIMLIERKIFGRVLWDLWLRIFLLLALAGLVAGSVEYLILGLLPQNWFAIFTAISVSGLIYLLFVWFLFYFSPEEKLWLKGKLTKRLA